MRASDFITEQPVTTTNAQGVTTTVNKAANRVTTKDAGGTVVRDRSGNMRSIATPKIGGLQMKQTFRPDATPGYQQATYQQGGTTLDLKGSPETGYTKTVGMGVGGLDAKATQHYSGQKKMDVSYNMGNNKKVSATSTISKPGTKPVTKMSLTQSQFEDVQAAIREHVAKRVPFTEQPVTTTNAQGVTTTVDKRNNRVTTKSDQGTIVKDRSGRTLSVQTPKIGGLQAKQTFRPDATPGYQKIDYTTGSGLNVSAKGSPETGYTTTVGTKVGGLNIQQTDATARGGKKTTDLSYQLNPNKTLKAKLTQSQFEDVQAAIREHVKQGIPFTECMFRAGSPAFTEFYRQVREVADKLNLDWQDQELLATDIGECIMVEGELVPLDVPMEVIEEELDERKENPFQMDLTAYDFTADKDNRKYADPDDPDRDYNKKTVSIQAQLRKSVSMNGAKEVEFTNGQVVKVPKNIAMTVLKKIDDIQTTQEKFKIIKIISKSYEHLVAFANDIKVTEAEYQGREVKLNSPKRGGSKKFYVYVKNPKTGRVKKISWGDTTGLSVKAKDRGAVRSFVARHKCKQANDKMTARYWSCRTPRYKALGVKGGQWW